MSKETPDERRATDAVGHALGRTLRRYELEPDGDESLDYIDDLNEVYEMKRVTPEEYRQLHASGQRWYPSSELAMHWSVLLEAPTLDDKFRPMPDFPDDDDATITAIEASGAFKVVRKTEREAEWSKRYSGQRIAVPRIGKREAAHLEQCLLMLEQGGITNTRGAEPRTDEERAALRQIHVLTHGAICTSRPPLSGDEGIQISVGSGYARTAHPNVLAFRAQAWLDSELGSNLAKSLRQSRFARRHGVLSFDRSEPEFDSAQEAGQNFVPTLDLTLPEDVDVLWCLIGHLLLCYDPADGWRSFETPD